MNVCGAGLRVFLRYSLTYVGSLVFISIWKTILKLFLKEPVKMSQRVEDHLASEWGQITPFLWQMLIMDSMKLILVQV